MSLLLPYEEVSTQEVSIRKRSLSIREHGGPTLVSVYDNEDESRLIFKGRRKNSPTLKKIRGLIGRDCELKSRQRGKLRYFLSQLEDMEFYRVHHRWFGTVDMKYFDTVEDWYEQTAYPNLRDIKPFKLVNSDKGKVASRAESLDIIVQGIKDFAFQRAITEGIGIYYPLGEDISYMQELTLRLKK